MSAGKIRDQVLVTANELDRELSTGRRLVLLDVRWSLAEPDGHRFYVAGHIPGALYVDLDMDLAAPADPALGRHPLPDIAELQARARRWGINDGDAVVVYDDTGGTSAARAWWLLRWGGISSVRILDGGLAAWNRSGAILEDGDVAVPEGNITLSPGHLPVIDIDGAAGWTAGGGALLDARAKERYRGDVEPVDPRAGHIPGAHSAPTAENLDSEGHFLPSEKLRERFHGVGINENSKVAVYCGSGITAAHEVAALASIGLDASLYPGSFSQWSADSARPVATGDGSNGSD